MPFNHLNTSFDNLFDPYVSGTKTCPAGEYNLVGQDIRDRYAPLSVGSKRANIGYQIDGTDISNYFAAKGTAQYWRPVFYAGELYSHGVGRSISSTATAEIRVSVINNGDVFVQAFSNGSFVTTLDSGNILPPLDSPTEFQVRLTPVSGNAGTSNSLTNWVTLNGSSSTQAGALVFRISRIGSIDGIGSTVSEGSFNLEFRYTSATTNKRSGVFTLRTTATIT